MLAKALGAEADGVIVDLEDAVPPADKALARSNLAEAGVRVRKTPSAPELHVRVNVVAGLVDVGDVEAAVAAGAHAIRLPKCTSAEQVREADGIMAAVEREQSRDVGSVALYPTIESAGAVVDAGSIAAGSERVAALVFGPADFLADIGVANGGFEACRWARGALVVASRVAGVSAPIDGAYLAYSDIDSLRIETQAVRELGFFGKSAIHPVQVPIINDVFTPQPAELERARKILAAGGGGSTGTVDGQFVDPPVVQQAMRTVDLAGQFTRRKAAS